MSGKKIQQNTGELIKLILERKDPVKVQEILDKGVLVNHVLNTAIEHNFPAVVDTIYDNPDLILLSRLISNLETSIEHDSSTTVRIFEEIVKYSEKVAKTREAHDTMTEYLQLLADNALASTRNGLTMAYFLNKGAQTIDLALKRYLSQNVVFEYNVVDLLVLNGAKVSNRFLKLMKKYQYKSSKKCHQVLKKEYFG